MCLLVVHHTRKQNSYNNKLSITRAPQKTTEQTIEEYEKTLYDSTLPTLEGDELGVPVLRKYDSYSTYDASKLELGSMFMSAATGDGYVLDSVGGIRWTGTGSRVSLFDSFEIKSGRHSVDISYTLPINPSKQNPELWEMLTTNTDPQEIQLKTVIGTEIIGTPTNIDENELPTMTFGDLMIRERGISGVHYSESGVPTDATTLTFSLYGDTRREDYFARPFVKIVDEKAPKIVKDELKGNYLYLTFNEPIRLTTKDIKTVEDINDFDPYVKNIDGVKVPATVVGFNNNSKTMILHVNAVERYKLDEDFTIRDFGFDNRRDIAIYTYGYNGTGLEKVSAGTYYDCTPICDYAGNPFLNTSSHSLNSLLVSSSPVGDILTISGDMLNENSSLSEDKWPDDIDRSSLFMGVGDVLTFAVEVGSAGGNETVMVEREDYSEVPEDDRLYLTLNIKDKDNENVKVPLVSTTNVVKPIIKDSNAGNEEGDEKTDEKTSVNKGKLVFEPLTIEEGMHIDGDSVITAMSMNASNSVVDICGNPITDQTLGGIVCAKQIFVDTTPPQVSNAIYTSDENEIAISVSINEDTKGSGMITKETSISLVGESYIGTKKLPVPVSYTCDGKTISTTLSDDVDTFTAYTKVMSNMNSEVISLPVTFTDTKNVTIKNLKAIVTTEDYAGNIETSEHSLDGYMIDKNAPTISLIASDISYTSNGAIFTGEFDVDDLDLIDAVATYKWESGNAVNTLSFIVFPTFLMAIPHILGFLSSNSLSLFCINILSRANSLAESKRSLSSIKACKLKLFNVSFPIFIVLETLWNIFNSLSTLISNISKS